MRSLRRGIARATGLALLAGLASLFAVPVPSEAQEPRIIELRVWVQDMHTKEDREFIPPGSTLQLEVGDKVRLRIQAIPQGEYNRPRYPSARWTPAGSQQEVRFSEFDERVGTVVVEALRYAPNVRTGVRFQLLDQMNLVRGVNPNGNLLIEVSQGRGGGPPGNPGPPPPSYASQGEDVTRALYRGILMREAEPRSVTERGRDIDRGGFDAVLRHAQDIADSRESRIDLYSRGTTNEQRLLALYDNLMGQSGRQIETRYWDANLLRLSRGDVAGVVTWMIRSEAFRRRYGYLGPRPRY